MNTEGGRGIARPVLFHLINCVQKARTQIDWPVLMAGRHTVRVNGPVTTKHNKATKGTIACRAAIAVTTT